MWRRRGGEAPATEPALIEPSSADAEGAQDMPERSLTTLTELFEEARFSPHPIATSTSALARRELERARKALPAGNAGLP